MSKSLEAWKKSVFGKTIDFDNASYDCVDVSKSWIMYLSDKPWQESAGWGNAKDIYFNWYATYLGRIPRGNAPKIGDIVVMNGNIGGGYGHTGVVVGIDGRNITIYQQNTFTQQPVYTGVFDAYANYITGFLRPKVAFTEGTAALEPYQRIPVSVGARYREQPNTSARIIEVFTPPEAVNFKGFVRGESVDGNDIWFVGRFTGGYSHSSGYTDSSTNGLPDLQPAEKPLNANQRKVGTDAMNIRSSAKVDTVNNNVIRLIQPGEVITVKGFVVGQNVDGNNRWFVLEDGTFTWSGGYTNQDVANLSDLTPKPPTPAPTGVGLNPGWIAPTDFHNTYDPAQSHYNWGTHGYQVGPTFNDVAWNQAAGPDTPWGLQQLAKPLTGAQIADLIAGKNVPTQAVQAASRREAYNPASMVTPNATNTYQLPTISAAGAIAPTTTSSYTPTAATVAQQAEIVKQLGADWMTRQQRAAAIGDWGTYNDIQNKVNAIINPTFQGY